MTPRPGTTRSQATGGRRRAPAEASATIHRLLPRRSAFVRKAVVGGGAQVVAANVDVAFLVTSLNADLNARRIGATSPPPGTAAPPRSSS
jgi:putative ribosome biogenesis GTPase RsgA